MQTESASSARISFKVLDGKLENQQNGRMKTTFDLPDSLVKQVKLRALNDGKKLKDAIAELLRKGLAAPIETAPESAAPSIRTDRKTGLPVIACKRAAPPIEAMTPERVAEILLAEEIGWHNDAGG